MSKKCSVRKILKLIAVDDAQYNRLREYGRTPESFNDIVRKLLNDVEDKKRKNVGTVEQEAILSK
jgi:predicted CopG family antitoxin